MTDDKPIDPRTQVLLSLLPSGAVFRHTYVEDALWCPDSRGYVHERDPLRAGLYQSDGYYAPWAPPSTVECSECDGTGEREAVNKRVERCEHCGGLGYVNNPGGRPNDHSFTIDAAELLSKYTVQDGTTLALLIDEMLQLRARVDTVTRQSADATIRLARALGYSDEDDLPPEGLDDLLVEVAWYVDAAEGSFDAAAPSESALL